MKRGGMVPVVSGNRLVVLAAAVLWVCLGVVVVVLGLSSSRGLEGTDEASYLLAAKNPWASPGYGLFFGFALHPLWEMTGHIATFRFGGVLALIGAALLFAGFLVRAGPCLGTGDIFRCTRPLILPSLAIAALARYTVGIRTPGYDWLLLFSALFFASAWLWVESRPANRKSLVPWCLLAMGGTGILLAKWTAFPGYLLLTAGLIFFKFLGAERVRAAGAVILWSVGWLGLFVLWATPEGIVETIRSGFAQMATGSHSGLFRHYGIGFLKGSWQVIRALPWIAILYGLVWLILRILRGVRPAMAEVAGISFLAGLGLAMARGYWLGGQTTFSKGMMITMVWLTGVYFMCRPYRSGDPRPSPAEAGTFRRVAATFALLPLLNGAGTATGITDYLGHGVVFFVALGWIFMGQAAVRGLPLGCVAAAVLCLGVIQATRAATTTLNTYRVGSVWVPELVPLTVGPEKGRLWTFPLAVESLQKIHAQMERAGFREGDPVIGITDCPGLVYLLGGTSPGACWYISYYLPENRGVKMNLANISPERLAQSWVIVRESARPSERLEAVWPTEQRVPLPIALDGDFYWPWGDGEGQPEKIFLYRPAGSGASIRR
jgi:hypothetical protein